MDPAHSNPTGDSEAILFCTDSRELFTLHYCTRALHTCSESEDDGRTHSTDIFLKIASSPESVGSFLFVEVFCSVFSEFWVDRTAVLI